MPRGEVQYDSVDEPLVTVRNEHGIATLTLNRPANYNALSSAMIAALHAALNAVATSDARVVILASRGRAFCAGHDLREMRAHPDETWQRALFDRCSALMLAIRAMPQPVIACVQGVATAAGCQLVATCDLAIASTDARFATSGIALGLFCSTPAVALTRTVSQKHAAELLFTGEFIDAARAEQMGLVNRIVAPEALLSATQHMAEQIARHSFHAIASGKRVLAVLQTQTQPQSQSQSLADAYKTASVNMARDMSSNDARIGIDAFLAKSSPPDWTHR